MTYVESATLMNDIEFRGRIKVSCLKYADYIHNEGPGTAGHTSRLRWAQSVYQNPEGTATQIQPPVVMDTAVQGAGAAITDEALQNAVENVVNRMI